MNYTTCRANIAMCCAAFTAHSGKHMQCGVCRLINQKMRAWLKKSNKKLVKMYCSCMRKRQDIKICLLCQNYLLIQHLHSTLSNDACSTTNTATKGGGLKSRYS